MCQQCTEIHYDIASLEWTMRDLENELETAERETRQLRAQLREQTCRSAERGTLGSAETVA